MSATPAKTVRIHSHTGSPVDALPTYIIVGEAWYRSTAIMRGTSNEISIVMVDSASPNEGCYWELAIRWHELGHKSHPRLEVFDESWEFLVAFPGVLADLAALRHAHGEACCSVADVVAILNRHGFVDRTPRETPEGHRPACPTCGGAR